MAATAAKFRAWCEVEAEKAEADKNENTKPAAFLASGLTSGMGATCFYCGPSVNHKKSVCRKLEDISAEDFHSYSEVPQRYLELWTLKLSYMWEVR